MTSAQISKMPYCPFSWGAPNGPLRCVGGQCLGWCEPFYCKRVKGEPSEEARKMILKAKAYTPNNDKWR